jgi:hypothetical protein
MPVNYYVGKTQAQLEALLKSLQSRASEGVISMMGGGSIPQTVRSWQGAARVEVEIKRVLWALHVLAPHTYADPYADRIRRTRTRYVYS